MMGASILPADRRCGWLGVWLILAMAAFGSASAGASADTFEPNNSIAAAAGPLLEAQSYSGTVDIGDSDFFFFYVTSPQGAKARVEIKNLGGGGRLSDVDLTVFDSTDTPRASVSFLRPGESGVVELELPTQKYFVEVTSREEPGDSYQFATSGGPGAFGNYDLIAGRCGATTHSAKALRKKISETTVKLQRALNQVRRSRYLGPTARAAARDRYRKTKALLATKRVKRRTVERSRRLWCSIPP
jgi:hypothetical protein